MNGNIIRLQSNVTGKQDYHKLLCTLTISHTRETIWYLHMDNQVNLTRSGSLIESPNKPYSLMGESLSKVHISKTIHCC